MFKKLVSNLPFSPSLVGQLSFYAQRLKKEESIRRLGLIFTVFALIIQSFAVFSPPESANAADGNDMCPGITANAAGASKIKSCYNSNTRHFKDVLSFFGISKTELWKALDSGVKWRDTSDYKSWYTFGHDKRSIDVKDYSSKVPGDLYARKWSNTIHNGQYGWQGKSDDTRFMILADCGNLALKRLLNPSARCISLAASKRSIVAGDSIILTAKASTDDGAEISKYDFNQTGPATASHSVSTNNESATWNRTLSKAGTYHFVVSIDTTNNKDNVTAKSCVANVTVTEKVSPAASCDKLTVTPTTGKKGTTFKITVNASASGGAGINKYNFTTTGSESYSWSQSTSATTSTWSLTPTAVGSYQASVSVDTTIGNKTSTGCNALFQVTETSNPSAECNLLSIEKVSRTDYKLSATASTYDGAKITGYSYVIKDASGKAITQSGNIQETSWAISLPDNTSSTDSITYHAILTVHTSVGDKTSADCEKDIVIPPVSDCETSPEAEGCAPEIHLVKTAINKSQGDQDATSVTANGGDVILYTITATNSGSTTGKVNISDIVVDTSEYATLTDAGGADFDENTKTLSWGDVEVGAESTATRTFVVTVMSPVPSTPQNNGSPDSYDCIMNNAISQDTGGSIDIKVNCPVVKEVVERTVIKQLPATGAGENILFGGIVAAIVVFFYARSRQLGKEIRLVRREFNSGTL